MNSNQALQALNSRHLLKDQLDNHYYKRDKSIFCNGVIIFNLPDTDYTIIPLKD